MPSLRKRVSSYFRQLSFYNEPREKKHNINENSFITKYLEGHINVKEGPPILYGKNPTDLPNYDLGPYSVGPDTVVGCYSGPNGGLTSVKRLEKHLSIPDTDIDFIDTQDEIEVSVSSPVINKSPVSQNKQTVDNTTMVIKVAGQEYLVTNRKKERTKSHSLGSLSDFEFEIEKTKICTDNNNSMDVKCKNQELTNSQSDNQNSSDNDLNKNQNVVTTKSINTGHKKSIGQKITKIEISANQRLKQLDSSSSSKKNFNLAKSKSEGNPFQHKKKGKIIRISNRPTAHGEIASSSLSVPQNILDPLLPQDWSRKSDYMYGISDSLYDKNQVTKNRNGDPIADCFGIIARNDSAILAVADGVNWGERASIAAKSAVHGCLHYLNKTIFSDTKLFDDLNDKNDSSVQKSSPIFSQNRISNTREVFICLLRAFNCAHDLILENEGMLTTLTVAVVLPLKQKNAKISKGKDRVDSINKSDRDKLKRTQQSGRNIHRNSFTEENLESYVCCVCNVGDTLAYVYSQKNGVRELTKGSHDVNCNRDMRDALGALGPVDGINPELSNLTLSVTTVQKGDIILVASDGLTDNFDPNVCKFTVNSKNSLKLKPPNTSKDFHDKDNITTETTKSTNEAQENDDLNNRPPIKPPRKNKDNISRSSCEKSLDLTECSELKNNDAFEDGKAAAVKQEINRESDDLKSLESKPSSSHEIDIKEVDQTDSRPLRKKCSTSNEYDNPLVEQFMRENSLHSEKSHKRTENKLLNSKPSSNHVKTNSKVLPNPPKVHVHKTASRNIPLNKNTEQRTVDLKRSSSKAHELRTSTSKPNATGFLRSKTSLEMRTSAKMIFRNEDGIPYVTPMQRYEISLLLMEDILKHGISGHDPQCTTAKQVCENLVNFTFNISSAKRRTLEDSDLYFDNINDILVEVSQQEKKLRRKKGLERVQNLPGKLDHVSIVAYNVGNCAFSY